MKKSSKIIISLIITILIVTIAVGGFLILQNKKNYDKKISELENKILLICDIEENITNTSTNNINSNSETNKNTTNDNTQNISSINLDNKENEGYNKYLGTWIDKNKNSELNVLSIANSYLSFSWTIYRIAGLDNVVVPIKNNTAVFYFQGYDDKNYNSKQDNGEHYYRKATIKLENDTIVIKVENISDSEYDISQEKNFDGQVYITDGTYTYNIK